ncbi:MupA/Atu3671 family FMN-dependent luciferase-like monooxygenase [Tumebacillus lipolyticus]|uniref:MupA/Atu3671 family FMN-dependent luciferase-like monooxygenase n=1 Tax=Tumebacillus lipolyticus TaxID=1280370 RepID=A0ABW4ZVW7_9BACL
MDFSIFFFSSNGTTSEEDKYRLIKEVARYADQHDFTGIWTPERHFDAFGGLYPNPSTISAALAMITDRIKLRAGSVVMPLQDPLRVAEEWAVVDNLSGGRVQLAFASGWHVNDFVLKQENFADRHAALQTGIETFHQLWAGESVIRHNGQGEPIEVKTYPLPIQPKVEMWLTCQADESFITAGEMGMNVLTNFTGKRIEDLARKVRLYQRARQRVGFDAETGKITLMMHTFVGAEEDVVREKVTKAYTDYLTNNLNLQTKHFEAAGSSDEEQESLIAHAVDRLFDSNGLVGTPETCEEIVERFQSIGVNEIACLIDFGIGTEDILANLPMLNELRKKYQD